MLCPCCITIFDREATKELEKTNPDQSKRVGRQDHHKELFFNKRRVPQTTSGLRLTSCMFMLISNSGLDP